MTDTEQKLHNQLINKSAEAFTMAIEIYNKPTLKYRVEGFAFFICNAWELMLKAYLIKTTGEESIYYPDKEGRTISLERCLRKVFSNENDPLRKNLECIIELRNTCTHFVTQEYEVIYAPIFQACVFNFVEKMSDFADLDITTLIPAHFIHLAATTTPFTFSDLKSKYGDIIATRIQTTQQEIEEETSAIHNSNFAITIRQDYYLTKKPDVNAVKIRIAKKDETNIDETVKIVKEVHDAKLTHPFTVKKVVELVQQNLRKEGIVAVFNKSTFQDFIKYFDLKNNPKFCYESKIGDKPVIVYSYSQQVIELIVEGYKKNPKCGENIHEELKHRSEEK